MSDIVLIIIVFIALAFVFGAILGFAAIRFKVDANPIVEQLDNLLPQTQCGQCGYPGCRPYAEAIANGDDINKCVPGGGAAIERIADLMGVDIPSQEPDLLAENPPKRVAFIHENLCIGCTRCIHACPVDAIVGAAKQMHTIVRQECTGCDLCVEPCPTNCIEMIELPATPERWKWDVETIPVRMIP